MGTFWSWFSCNTHFKKTPELPGYRPRKGFVSELLKRKPISASMPFRSPPRVRRRSSGPREVPEVFPVHSGRSGKGAYLCIAASRVTAVELSPLHRRAIQQGKTVSMMHMKEDRASSASLVPISAWLKPWRLGTEPLEIEAIGVGGLLALGAIAMFPKPRSVRLNLISPPLVLEPSILDAVARSARTTIYVGAQPFDLQDRGFLRMVHALGARTFHAEGADLATLLSRTAGRKRLTRVLGREPVIGGFDEALSRF